MRTPQMPYHAAIVKAIAPTLPHICAPLSAIQTLTGSLKQPTTSEPRVTAIGVIVSNMNSLSEVEQLTSPGDSLPHAAIELGEPPTVEAATGDVHAGAGRYNADTPFKKAVLVGIVMFLVITCGIMIVIADSASLVLGHLILHYAIPETYRTVYILASLPSSASIGAIGSVIVHVLPFFCIVIHVTLTKMHRLESLQSPNLSEEFSQSRYFKHPIVKILLNCVTAFVVAPVGAVVFRGLCNNTNGRQLLDPYHAALAGAVGSLTMAMLHRVRQKLKGNEITEVDAELEAQSKIEQGSQK